MSSPEYQVNSKKIPKEFPREFDAHIYFTTETLDVAQRLRDQIKTSFADQKVFVGDLIPVPIGPHPLPMFEVNFPRDLFAAIVLWLMHKRGRLNVLVHEITDNDYIDHTQGAIWLGTPVALDYDLLKS